MITVSDLRTRHPWTPGLHWIILDERFVLDIPACRRPYPHYHPSPTLWVSPISSPKKRRLMMTFPWVLPFLNGWMSRWTSFKARAVWVRPSVLFRTLRVSTPDSQPCTLVDIYQWTLNHCLRARGRHPRGTRCVAHRAPLSLRHSKCRLRRPKSSSVLRVMTSQLSENSIGWRRGRRIFWDRWQQLPRLLPTSSITLLQRYALETWRSVELLERSPTARYANRLWRLRDGHLSKLHSSVATKESLRQAPLLSNHLFPEETVAIAGLNLRGDVQHLNLSKSLKFFIAAKHSTGNKALSQPPRAKVHFQQPIMAAGRGRGGQGEA